MLYLGIDVHRKQLTVSVRNEAGEVVVRRQVSTEWPRVRAFLTELAEQAKPEGGYVAMLEVCGFHDWVLKMLTEYGCRETVIVSRIDSLECFEESRSVLASLSAELWLYPGDRTWQDKDGAHFGKTVRPA